MKSRSRLGSAGPNTGSDTKGIVINGRSIINQTPGSSISQLNLSPMTGSVNLGEYTPRLAAEADLWQEFRFTKLKVFYLPAEAIPNRNQATIVGYTNVYPNYGVASASDILSMPCSHVFALGSAGTAYNGCNGTPRMSFSIPKAALRPALVPWLKTSNSVGDLVTQGVVYSYWNYTASTGTALWMYVEWECEFRNPIAAGETLVLRRSEATYAAKLRRALAEIEAKKEESDDDSAIVVRGVEPSDNAKPRSAQSVSGEVSDVRSSGKIKANRHA